MTPAPSSREGAEILLRRSRHQDEARCGDGAAMIGESRPRPPALLGFTVPLAALLRLALYGGIAAALAVPFLWLDYQAHTRRERILVEYLHPETGEATVDGIEEPQPAPIYQNQTGALRLTVNHADRRVKLGLNTLFGDSRARIAGALQTRCYYDAKLVAYEDLWSERLLRRRERARATFDGDDTRRPLAIVEATFAYCDPNGLTRRERRERDRPRNAQDWLERIEGRPLQR
jgi:hypothetical protein